jgi:hypothetical protein
MLSPLYGQLSPLRVPTTDIAMLTASAYIAAIEAADGQNLESGVKSAFTDFIVGCHNDGIWSALKACCILAGARTLSGALVPLVGSAPTNFNFVSGDYNRKSGLKGNGTTKYLNSNRAENSDPQNNFHICANLTFHNATANRTILGATDLTLTPQKITEIYDGYGFRMRGGLKTVTSNSTASFVGGSRASSSEFTSRVFSSTSTTSANSVIPTSNNFNVFGRNNNGALSSPSAHRLSFYSIGESLNLAALDSRVSTLMTDLAAAIP